MKLQKIKHDFSICKLNDLSLVDFTDEFCFVGKTDEELSLVCITSHVPSNTLQREDGWKAFRVQGELEFSLIGILSTISTLLSKNGISIFAVSTYNTDYILTKTENFSKAVKILEEAGFQINTLLL